MNKMQDFSVAIVAANYNNGPYLRDFFAAIARSTVQPTELIFVDDGSSDDSLSIAERFTDALPYLKIIRLATNQGFARALNAGIAEATSDYIFRVDPDDIPGDAQLERQIKHLQQFDLDVVGTNATIFQSETGRVLGQTNFPVTGEEIAKRIKNGEHGVLHATVLAKKSLFKKQPYEQANVPAEDYDIFARFLKAGAKFGNLKDPLLSYRVHASSASSSLRYSMIERTYNLRDQTFGTRTSKVTVMLYYVHIKAYRKYLMSKNAFSRVAWASVSACATPWKVLRRLKRMIRSANRAM
jgi:glycosyltransferase involved in cell wall biosynthesis